jgi:hypothetical protein
MPIQRIQADPPLEAIVIESDFAGGSLTVTANKSTFGYSDGELLFTARGSLNGTPGRTAEPNHIRIRGRHFAEMIHALQALADQELS